MTERAAVLVAHTGRETTRDAALQVVDRMRRAGVTVRLLHDEAGGVGLAEAARSRPDADLAPVRLVDPDDGAADGAEIVLCLGGDGTLLRGAELARPSGVPLLGVNLGRVGFLAEVEPGDLDTTVDDVLAGRFRVEERMTVDVAVRRGGEVVEQGWALNEASLEKRARERLIDVLVEVEGRPLSRWGCDGVVCATPTGSTAYAFSAGGPVVWPSVAALLVVPVSAHALFARPLVVDPATEVGLQLMSDGDGGVLWCDGRRVVDVLPGDRIEVHGGRAPVRVARTSTAGFTDRLVAKFDLPVHGWRGRGA